MVKKRRKDKQQNKHHIENYRSRIYFDGHNNGKRHDSIDNNTNICADYFMIYKLLFLRRLF